MARENNDGGEELDFRDSLELSTSTQIGGGGVSPCRVFKIIVIGDTNVGKTCLTYRFCGGSFLKNPEATIGVDFREKTLELDGEVIKLQIWDTAGQERFRKSMVDHYYRSAHAVIFVYDVTNPATFQSIPDWVAECGRHGVGPLVPRVVVGNKCDLRALRQVPTSAGQRLADGHGAPLFETSAKDAGEKEHVDAIFLTLAHRLKSRKPLRLKPPTDDHVGRLWEPRRRERVACQC
ncbi:ras-related protein Rab-33B isoform X1 [Stigmatopora nigra]